MGKISTKKLTAFALLMALTVVMTMIIQLPMVVGYVNLGDMVLLFTAMILGKKAGLFVGGLGSALADIFLGYAYYAPITFIVKGLEGYICGWIFEKNHFQKPMQAVVPSGIFMALGYFIAEIVMYTFGAATAAIPGNLAQAFVGALAAVFLEKSIGEILRKRFLTAS